jgi:hypothetical protein
MKTPCDGAADGAEVKTSKAGTMGARVFQRGGSARRDAFVIRVCSGDIVRETADRLKLQTHEHRPAF